MKLKSAVLLGTGTIAMIAGGGARATYIGLSAEVHTTISTGSGPKSVYRIYANFTDCEDLLFGWSGPTTDPIEIRSLDPIGQGPGSNFFNPVSI